MICRFRGQEIKVEHKNKKFIDLDFNGHYLIQVDRNFKPTSNAMDESGNPLRFEPEELIIKKEIR